MISNNTVLNTTEICATWSTNSSDSSAPPFNFSYTIPSWGCQIGSNYLTSNGNVIVSTSSYYIYDWQDPTLNSTWLAHFKSDPYTSQWYDWASWKFYPSDANNFRCITQNNVYQVSSTPLNKLLLNTYIFPVGIFV